MKDLKTIIQEIETFAPPQLAPFDYVGLLQGDLNRPISKIAITLDYSYRAIEEAIRRNCDLLITHHGPHKIDQPLAGNNLQKTIIADTHNLAIYRCHLNLDFCNGGIIDELCKLLKVPAKPVKTDYNGFQLYGGVRLAEQYPLTIKDIQQRASVLGISTIRIAGTTNRKVFTRIAVTSGKGFIEQFFDQLQPDLYIAGEFEQEATKYAEDLGITLVELSHHASESRPLEIIANTFSKLFMLPVEHIEIPDTIRTLSVVENNFKSTYNKE